MDMNVGTLRQRLLRVKVLVGLGLLAGVSAFGTWLYRYNQTPAVGVIQTPVPQPQVEAVSSLHFNGVAIAFDYPSDYTTVENTAAEPRPPITEQYSLRGHDAATGSRRISIMVKDFAGGTMLEDSAYTFRTLPHSGYKADDVTVGDRSARKLTKKDGSEITYFIPGDKAYAIIAATSGHPDAAFEEETKTLIQSFVWR